jgi:hypothetical protein
MFKEVMNDLWLARISSLSNEVALSSIKTFDFSTLYTTLPHDKLKTRLKETIHKAFSQNLLIFYKLLKKLRLI